MIVITTQGNNTIQFIVGLSIKSLWKFKKHYEFLLHCVIVVVSKFLIGMEEFDGLTTFCG